MSESPDDVLGPASRDSEALRRFLGHFGIDPGAERSQVLRRVLASFATLPYENLTKIIRAADGDSPGRSRRGPLEVVVGHARHGTGGTCFALTATLLHLVRGLGWQARPLLADRRYGEDTHCALVVDIDGVPCLVDPGYLLVDPIPLELRGPLRVSTGFNEVILTPRDGGERLDLSTAQEGRETHRLSFRTAPADPDRFLAAWDRSFSQDMMRYPVVTRATSSGQLYLQDRRWQARSRDGVSREAIDDDELVRRVAKEFRIDSRVVREALAILERRGERRARAL